MPIQRGLVPPAILASTIVLVGCSIAWGALGMLSADDPAAMSSAMHRFLCMLLMTVTLGAAMVHLTARIIRAIARNLDAISSSGPATVCGYVEGYTDGLDAAPVSPAVTRLVPSRR